MTYLEIELGFVSPNGATDDDFDEFLDCVMEELESIGREDVDLVASLAKRTAMFVVTAEDDDFNSVAQFMGDLRAALHAARCGTQAWPDVAHFKNVRIRGSELLTA